MLQPAPDSDSTKVRVDIGGVSVDLWVRKMHSGAFLMCQNAGASEGDYWYIAKIEEDGLEMQQGLGYSGLPFPYDKGGAIKVKNP